VQGKQEAAAEKIIHDAKKLEQAGCFAVVLECMPPDLAKKITQQLSIPTIGIGAGVNVDGQVLVLHDLLGMYCDFKPKFVKQYFTGFAAIESALNNYNKEVKGLEFPTEEHSYS
jgi:3-methyl-2-oxobutanoate hydroxymethyltransferase